MLQSKESHTRKHDREKLKNAFKDKFRSEISGYVSDLDLNIYHSGRSSSSSNYNQIEKDKKSQHQAFHSMISKNSSRPQSEMTHYTDFQHEKKRTKNTEQNNDIKKDSIDKQIVPLNDEELNANITTMPSFDDSSDSQASKNNATTLSTITIRPNKNFTSKKTISTVRSKSPGARKFTLQRPSSKLTQRSKSPSFLSNKTRRSSSRQKINYDNDFDYTQNDTQNYEINNDINNYSTKLTMNSTISKAPKGNTSSRIIKTTEENTDKPKKNKPQQLSKALKTNINFKNKELISNEKKNEVNERSQSPTSPKRKSRIPERKSPSPKKKNNLFEEENMDDNRIESSPMKKIKSNSGDFYDIEQKSMSKSRTSSPTSQKKKKSFSCSPLKNKLANNPSHLKERIETKVNPNLSSPLQKTNILTKMNNSEQSDDSSDKKPAFLRPPLQIPSNSSSYDGDDEQFLFSPKPNSLSPSNTNKNQNQYNSPQKLFNSIKNRNQKDNLYHFYQKTDNEDDLLSFSPVDTKSNQNKTNNNNSPRSDLLSLSFSPPNLNSNSTTKPNKNPNLVDDLIDFSFVNDNSNTNLLSPPQNNANKISTSPPIVLLDIPYCADDDFFSIKKNLNDFFEPSTKEEIYKPKKLSIELSADIDTDKFEIGKIDKNKNESPCLIEQSNKSVLHSSVSKPISHEVMVNELSDPIKGKDIENNTLASNQTNLEDDKLNDLNTFSSNNLINDQQKLDSTTNINNNIPPFDHAVIDKEDIIKLINDEVTKDKSLNQSRNDKENNEPQNKDNYLSEDNSSQHSNPLLSIEDDSNSTEVTFQHEEIPINNKHEEEDNDEKTMNEETIIQNNTNKSFNNDENYNNLSESSSSNDVNDFFVQEEPVCIPNKLVSPPKEDKSQTNNENNLSHLDLNDENNEEEERIENSNDYQEEDIDLNENFKYQNIDNNEVNTINGGNKLREIILNHNFQEEEEDQNYDQINSTDNFNEPNNINIYNDENIYEEESDDESTHFQEEEDIYNLDSDAHVLLNDYEVQESIKNKHFPPDLLKNIVLSISNVPKILDDSPKINKYNEDLIFALQERMCSLIEVEVITKGNKSMNLFPLDLNNYIRNGKCILKKEENENQTEKAKGSKKFSLRRPKPKSTSNNKALQVPTKTSTENNLYNDEIDDDSDFRKINTKIIQLDNREKMHKDIKIDINYNDEELVEIEIEDENKRNSKFSREYASKVDINTKSQNDYCDNKIEKEPIKSMFFNKSQKRKYFRDLDEDNHISSSDNENEFAMRNNKEDYNGENDAEENEDEFPRRNHRNLQKGKIGRGQNTINKESDNKNMSEIDTEDEEEKDLENEEDIQKRNSKFLQTEKIKRIQKEMKINNQQYFDDENEGEEEIFKMNSRDFRQSRFNKTQKEIKSDRRSNIKNFSTNLNETEEEENDFENKEEIQKRNGKFSQKRNTKKIQKEMKINNQQYFDDENEEEEIYKGNIRNSNNQNYENETDEDYFSDENEISKRSINNNNAKGIQKELKNDNKKYFDDESEEEEENNTRNKTLKQNSKTSKKEKIQKETKNTNYENETESDDCITNFEKQKPNPKTQKEEKIRKQQRTIKNFNKFNKDKFIDDETTNIERHFNSENEIEAPKQNSRIAKKDKRNYNNKKYIKDDESEDENDAFLVNSENENETPKRISKIAKKDKNVKNQIDKNNDNEKTTEIKSTPTKRPSSKLNFRRLSKKSPINVDSENNDEESLHNSSKKDNLDEKSNIPFRRKKSPLNSTNKRSSSSLSYLQKNQKETVDDTMENENEAVNNKTKREKKNQIPNPKNKVKSNSLADKNQVTPISTPSKYSYSEYQEKQSQDKKTPKSKLNKNESTPTTTPNSKKLLQNATKQTSKEQNVSSFSSSSNKTSNRLNSRLEFDKKQNNSKRNSAANENVQKQTTPKQKTIPNRASSRLTLSYNTNSNKINQVSKNEDIFETKNSGNQFFTTPSTKDATISSPLSNNSDISPSSRRSYSDSPSRFSSPRRDSFESPSKLSAALADDNSDYDPDIKDDLLNESPEEKYGIAKIQGKVQNQTLFTASSIINIENSNKDNLEIKGSNGKNPRIQTKSHPMKTFQKKEDTNEITPINTKSGSQNANSNDTSAASVNPPVKRTKPHFSLKRPQKKPKK